MMNSTNEGVTIVDRARVFAINAHGDQRYGDQPYSVHLAAVEQTLVEFNFTEPIYLAAAWLHDVVEDTDVSIAEIKQDFPGLVADIVNAVTTEQGMNRKERNRATYPKIAALSDAIPVKIADRIANVRKSIETKDSRLRMYHDEHPEFRTALHQSGDVRLAAMWTELDRLLDDHGA